MLSSSRLLAAAALLPAAFAHYNFEALIVNGNVTDPYEYVRQTNNSNSPITDYTSTDMRCNAGGLLASTMAQTSTYTVAAGDNVGFTIDAALSHPGPLSVWMSKAPSKANTYDGSGDWFKVYELTYDNITSAGLQWATYPIGTSGLTNFTIDLPSELPAGEYLMRAEHIALHAAEEVGGAQYYIGCAQLKVTGDGAGTPTPTSSIPGQYKGTEPGLVIDIYYPIPTNYTAPGIGTWPGDCISHEANTVGSTYLGMCVSEEGVDTESAGAAAATSAATSAAAATSVAAQATTSAAVVASSSAAPSVAAVPSSSSSVAVLPSSSSSIAPVAVVPSPSATVSASASLASAASPASTSKASTCSKKKRSAKKL